RIKAPRGAVCAPAPCATAYVPRDSQPPQAAIRPPRRSAHDDLFVENSWCSCYTTVSEIRHGPNGPNSRSGSAQQIARRLEPEAAAPDIGTQVGLILDRG